MPVPLFDTTMDVYAPNLTDGAYTVQTASGVRCRLIEFGSGMTRSREERASMIGYMLLVYDPAATVLPDDAQVEMRGDRWNVVAGSDTDFRGPTGKVAYHSCDVALSDA